MSDFVTKGRFVRVGTLRAEWYNEVQDPDSVVAEIKQRKLPMDIFSFVQRPPVTAPRLPYFMEMDHLAAIPISTFDNWWDNQVSKKVRKNVRRSRKYGITVKSVPFNDELVAAIERIYREAPVRGGRLFDHYCDDFATCKRKHETHLERSEFLAAFYEGEIIGFIKMVFAGETARTMQNISLARYRDMSAPNALLAKAVEVCAERNLKYLVFGKFSYGKKGNDGQEEFKMANGFTRLEFPRYYIPLTAVGAIAVKHRWYHEASEFFPAIIVKTLRDLRTVWYGWKFRREMAAIDAMPKQVTVED